MSHSLPSKAVLGAPFEACNALAAAKNANLYRAAMRLSPERQRFFLASYASMRVIDDIVDDGFLELPDAERHAQREPFWKPSISGRPRSFPPKPVLTTRCRKPARSAVMSMTHCA